MFVIVCSFIAIILTFLWIRSRKPANFPPGPTPFPVIGNLHNLAEEGNFLQVIRKLRKQYGDIFSLSLGKNWVVVVNGRKNLKELFVKKGDYTSDRPDSVVTILLKRKGIMSASGSSWKHNRTFAMTKLRGFGFGKRSFEANIMEEVTEFLKYVDGKAGCPFQLNDILYTSVINALMSILTGKRFEYTDNRVGYFANIIKNISSNPTVIGPVNYMPWLARLPFDPFGVDKLLHMFEDIFAYWKSIIQEHKDTFDEKNLDNFIDIYLHEMAQVRNSDQFAEDQLLSIISDIFIAGTDSTAIVIKWFILYMLNYPDVQDKMQAEIAKSVGNGRPPALSDKSDLPYCQAVMYETLRFCNIGPIAMHHLVTGDIEHNGFAIPKGCLLLPCLESVAFDEETFPDSNSFKPDRFLGKDGQFNVTDSNNILTFSLGRRVYMGESLAKMEIFLYITSLVQRFTFRPPDNEPIPSVDPLFGFVQNPKPFNVRAVSRI